MTVTVIYVFNIQMWTNLVCRNGGIRGLPPIELQPLQQGDRSNSCRDLGMIDDDLKPELKPEEAKPLTSAPPKLRPRTHADNALPSRSRAFRKTAPPKPELKPEEKENIHEKEEEEAEVQPHHQAHDAVAVVDLQAWQARGLARDAMRREDIAGDGDAQMLVLKDLLPYGAVPFIR